ncbi:MAG: Maf family protein [Eubacteriales bacterium]|nr:Maf family protein [Eubacteriales bacterium]
MIILASQSPRRKEILSVLFGDIHIKTNNHEESFRSVRPSSAVMEIAKKKVIGVGTNEDVVIGADTIVYYKGEFLGKPKDEEDAKRILRKLSGNTHYVYTGVAIKTKGKTITFYDKSKVIFNKLSNEFIEKYVSSGSPMDKAGAYGVQDGGLVKKYVGSYTNILGLPVEKLEDTMRSLKVEVK